MSGGGSENSFAFGTTRPPGSPTPGESATVSSDTPLCSVRVRDLKGGETLYKIKRHGKMGGVFSAHANQRSTTLDFLRSLLDGQRVHKDQTPSSLNLDGSSEIDCCSAQGEFATPWLANLEGNSWMDCLRLEGAVFEDTLPCSWRQRQTQSQGAPLDVVRSSTQSRGHCRENPSCLKPWWP